MKDAQRISSPTGIPTLSRPSESLRGPAKRRGIDSSDMVDEAHQKLETIANAVQCFVLALPAYLKFRNQYLGFDAREPGQLMSLRLMHCSIHNIYVMTQLAKLMIYRYDVFWRPDQTLPANEILITYLGRWKTVSAEAQCHYE
jgi:hypothetical protein